MHTPHPVRACGGYCDDCSSGDIEFATVFWIVIGIAVLVSVWGA
jgi:hypothetical protein